MSSLQILLQQPCKSYTRHCANSLGAEGGRSTITETSALYCCPIETAFNMSGQCPCQIGSIQELAA